MEHHRYDEQTQPGILAQIHEGMKVYDANNHEVGSIKWIYMGTSSQKANERGLGAATAQDPDLMPADNIVENIAEALGGDDDLPETVRNRLLREGFVRIDGIGLFSADYYATPDQIAGIVGGSVKLTVARQDLTKV